MENRKIIHIDMDAFYASIEQRDHPEYRGKPLVVGRPEKRGVVGAAVFAAPRGRSHQEGVQHRVRLRCAQQDQGGHHQQGGCPQDRRDQDA